MLWLELSSHIRAGQCRTALDSGHQRMPAAAQDALLRAPASYQKKPGTLELTATHVQWTAANASKPALKIRTADAASAHTVVTHACML